MNYQKEREQVSKHFKAIRRRLGISQAEFALQLEIGRTVYTKYETGVIVAPSDKYVRAVNLSNGDKKE